MAGSTTRWPRCARDFLPADLKSAMASAGIDGTIAVQARQTIDETRWLLNLADANDAIRGVVGWAPIAGEEFPGVMEEFDGRAKLKGLRHVIQDEPDEHYILREDFNSGIRTIAGQRAGLRDTHLRAPPGGRHHLCGRASAAAICAGPYRQAADRRGPDRAVGRAHDRAGPPRECVLQALRNGDGGGLACGPAAARSLATLKPYLDVAVEAFGATRLMAGSDWPVCLLATTYAQWFELLRSYFAGFSGPERAAIFGGTAIEVYGL